MSVKKSMYLRNLTSSEACCRASLFWYDGLVKKWTLISGIGLLLACAVGVSYRPMNTRLRNYSDRADETNPLFVSAMHYLDTRPQYKSAYYAGSGYPTDHYGTCVDVIGIALRDCGYDLRTKLNDDVLANSDRYDIDVPDIDIDFRRVKNLKIYFASHEQVLTTDLNDTDAWQAGDLVLFANHIAMVSDYRNAKGTPYVIHHRSFFQLRYEEDYLNSHQPKLHIRVRLEE